MHKSGGQAKAEAQKAGFEWYVNNGSPFVSSQEGENDLSGSDSNEGFDSEVTNNHASFSQLRTSDLDLSLARLVEKKRRSILHSTLLMSMKGTVLLKLIGPLQPQMTKARSSPPLEFGFCSTSGNIYSSWYEPLILSGSSSSS